MLKGIYNLNLLYANGKFKFIESGQEVHALICFSHGGKGKKLGSLLELF